MAAQSPQTQVAQLPQSISAENPHAGLPIPLPSQSTSSRNVQLASPNSSQQNTSRPSTPKSHNGCQSWQRDDRVQFSTQGGYQVNPISAYNPSPAPQPSSDSISMSLRKSTRRRPLTSISSNLTVKDLRVTNKRVRSG